MKKDVKKTKKNNSKKFKKIPEIKVRKISPDEFEKNLEEIAGDEEPEFNLNQFQEFLQKPNFSFESETPILKKIENIPKQEMNLEKNIEIFSPVPEKKEEETSIKYQQISADYESLAQRERESRREDLVFHQPIHKIRWEEQKIDLIGIPKQGLEINSELHELRQNQNLDKDYVVGVGESLKEKRARSPFEQQEKKYDFFKG